MYLLKRYVILYIINQAQLYSAVINIYPNGSHVIYFAKNQGLYEVPSNIPPNITTVLLDRNQIEDVADFPYVPGLLILHLPLNKLRQFPNVDSVNGTLEELHLQQNIISSISADRLNILGSLRILWLTNNLLTAIPNVAGPRSSLAQLKLGYNNIKTFPVLDELGNSLTVLELSYNRMKNIEKYHLRGMPLLVHLDVSYNNLTEVPDLSEIGATLEQLQISGNKMRRIDPARLDLLQKLAWFFGGDMGLERIPDFTNSPSRETLLYILVSDNLISEIPLGLFQPLTAFGGLSIPGNRLTTVPNFCHLDRLFMLHLLQNDFKCDCRMRWLKEADAQGGSIVQPSLFKPCVQPPELMGTVWSSISMESLVCNDTNNMRATKQSIIRPIKPTYTCAVRDVVTWVQASSVFECAGHCLDAPGCRFFRYGDPDSSPHDNTCGITDEAAPAADILDVSRPEAWYTLDSIE